MKDDEINQAEFKCSECGSIFVPELNDLILSGKVVYCERCGYPFKKDQAKGATTDRASQPKGFSQGFSTSNRDTSARININLQRDSSRYQQAQQPVSPQRPVIPPRPVQPPRPQPPVNKPAPKKVSQQDINGVHNAIETLISLIRSPLIPIVTLIISIIRLAFIGGSPTPLATASDVVARLIVMLMIYTFTLREITPKLMEGDYSSLGIDAIIFGSIGIAAYGMGGLILAVGILVLIYQLMLQNNHLLDQIIPEELNFEILGMNIIEVVIKRLNLNVYRATAYVVILGIPTILSETSFILGATWFYIIMFILSLFMLKYINDQVTNEIELREPQYLDDSLLVKSIVFAAICLSFVAAGAFLMILIILIYIYREGVKDVAKKLEIRRANGKPFPVPNPENKNRINITESKEQEPPSIQSAKDPEKIKIEFERIQQILKPVEAKTSEQQPKVESIAINKETELKNKITAEEPKKPEKAEEKSRTQLVDSLETKKIESKVPEKVDLSFEKDIDIKNQKDIESYLNKVFTVLTKDTRKRILSLDIPDEQKVDVLREFVNLKEEQQEKYLKELENVNQKISKDLIKRIYRMKIPEDEKQTLINQLEFMTPENQQNFVKFLEAEQIQK